MPFNNTIPTALWNPLAPKPAMSTFGSSQAPKAPIAPIKTFGQSKAPIQGTISPSNSQTSPVVSAAQSEPPQYNAVTNTGTSQGGIKGMMGTTPPPIQPYGSQQYSQQNPPAFAPIVGALANTAQQQSPKATELVGQTQAAANTNPLESGGAYDVYNEALKTKQQFDSSLADLLSENRMNPSALHYMEGRAGAIQQANASKALSLEQRITRAQQALGYGIQQQGQQISGLNQAAGQANTQQTLAQSGLQQAGSLAKPDQYSLMSAPYNSLSDTYGGGGASGAVGRAAQAGNIQAAQSNAQQQGTAGTDIARQGLQQATNDYAQMTNAAQFTQNQSNAVKNILDSAGLNSVSSKDYTKVLNNLKSRFGDTNFAALNTAMIEARSAYANLLSTGGQTPSGNEWQTINTLDMNQSAAAIKASIQELDNAVSRRLSAQQSQKAYFQSQLNGGGGNQGGQQGGNSYTTPGGKTFNFD